MPAPRKRSLRSSLTILLALPLTIMIALWGFAAALTATDGLRLRDSLTVFEKFADPSQKPVAALREERLATVLHLTKRKKAGWDRLVKQRAKTDKALAEFLPAATSAEVEQAAGGTVWKLIRDVEAVLDQVKETRATVSARSVTPLQALRAYNRIIDPFYLVYHAMISGPDVELYRQNEALVLISESRELLTREDALISAAVLKGRMTRVERAAFGEAVSARRLLFQRGLAGVHPKIRTAFRGWQDGNEYRQLAALEDVVATAARGGSGLPAKARTWSNLYEAVHGEVGRSGTLSDLMDSQPRVAADQITAPIATGIIVRVAVAGGLGLVAVIATIWLSLRFGRRLIRELARLRDEAGHVADVRLPRIVDRLQRGENVDIRAETPALSRATLAEVRGVGEAFTRVQRTAVLAAVGQAELRRGFGLVFLNLARRSQSLLQRQLAHLDHMQRRTPDPDTLEDLFKLDHLTTRMRRHAEGLIILSGAPPGRAWRSPIPVIDVLRASIAEVEDYQRVLVASMPEVALAGPVVADIVHLIAELVENATIFSPSDSQVYVRGELVEGGFAVEIEDQGLGMSAEDYAYLNERLSYPAPFDPADTERLGLFIVSRLAARHNVRVMLRPGRHRQGTSAILLIPQELLSVATEQVEVSTDPEMIPVSQEYEYEAGYEQDGEYQNDEYEQDYEEEYEYQPGYEYAEADQPEYAEVGSEYAEAGTEYAAVGGQEYADDEPGVPEAIVAEQHGYELGYEPEVVVDESAPRWSVSSAADLFTPRVPVTAIPDDVDDEPAPAAESAPAAKPAPAPEPAPEAPAVPASAMDGPTTVAGLPRRIRQANLAPGLRGDPVPAVAPSGGERPATDDRAPEEAQALVNAFRTGWNRGQHTGSTIDGVSQNGKRGDKG